jgi:SAM-dependent methyltransferase
VSIGCMHHTGNVQKCFDETFRVLKPNGVAILMVYNRFSYMRWRTAPWTTFRNWLNAAPPAGLESAKHRADHDANTEGKAAPEVALLSVREIKQMLGSFAAVACTKHNANEFAPKGITLVPRPWLLPTLGRLLGLDIYVEARKGSAQVQRVAA